MSCVINRFKFKIGEWIKLPQPDKPGKIKYYKVIAENNFHQSKQPSSFPCGCNYKLSSKANLISGKDETLVFSQQSIKTIQWHAYLNSTRLDQSKVTVLKSDKADKIEQEIQSKKRNSRMVGWSG